mgnify:CR=1 FL=1
MKLINKHIDIIKLIIYILLLTTLLTIFNLIFNINNTLNSFISLILISLYIFISNINNGKKITDKAYKVGLKRGIKTIIILFILNLLTFNIYFKLTTLYYYLIIIFISILGSIIGINIKNR